MEKVIEGEETNAVIKTDQYDETTEEQVQEIVDHPAFQNEIVVMPDCHAGAGAVIGFTMPIGQRVVPNTVGVDIGCGMTALNMGQHDWLDVPNEDNYEEIDEEIRNAVPMGRNVHSNSDYHIVNDFPWDECQEKLEAFEKYYGFQTNHKYGEEYFKELCQRIEYDVHRAINSIGSLGGGNHFVEVSESQETGDYWCVVHSGSRGIGLTIANYWQDESTDKTFERNALVEIPEGDVKYFDFDENHRFDGDEVYAKPTEMSIDRESVLEDYDGEAIDGKFGQLHDYLNAGKKDSSPLDWLEGDEAVGYFIDMIFAQKYASESRKEMCHAVSDVLDAEMKDMIESTHNFISFEDGIIRKGATSARDGERLIIPFNMAEGAIICEGKGNEEWNWSAPHGAGRRMSRTRAFNELGMESFEEEMEDVHSTSVTEETLDEAPQAYKDKEVIESVIGETAEVVDRLEPVLNLKAEE